MSIREDVFVPSLQPPGGRRPRWPFLAATAIVLVATGLTIAALVWDEPSISVVDEPSRPYTSPIGYTVKYPEGWVVSRFEGHDELRPAGEPSLARGESTFAIDITTPDLTSGPTCDVRPEAIMFRDGIPASGCEIQSIGGEVDTWYTATFGSPSVNIVVHVVSSTSDRFSKYDPTARAILETLGPVPVPVASRGIVAPGISMTTTTTRTLIGFLESRVQGQGADYWMMQNAADLYESHADGLSLYVDTSGSPWTSYEVTAERGVDANSVEFDVTMRSDATSSEETMGVGAGTNVAGLGPPAVVRFAVKASS